MSRANLESPGSQPGLSVLGLFSMRWNEQHIQSYIGDSIEEGQKLEYKAADALAKSAI